MMVPRKQVGGNHYERLPLQPLEFTVANRLLFVPGNAVKYLCRHSHKDGRLDVQKAIDYLTIWQSEPGMPASEVYSSVDTDRWPITPKHFCHENDQHLGMYEQMAIVAMCTGQLDVAKSLAVRVLGVYGND